MTAGTLYGLGVGPGDPELLTLKALRILQAAPILAYLSPEGGASFARSIVAPHLAGTQEEIAIPMPMRVDLNGANAAYDAAASRIAARLHAGLDVAALCEGDPFFYGSFTQLFARLGEQFRTVVVPGVSSVMAAAAAGRPLARRNDVFAVLPAPLPDKFLTSRIAAVDGFAIIKLGRHFGRVRALLDALGLTETCLLAQRVSVPGAERLTPLNEAGPEAPYFALILGRRENSP